MNMSSKSSRLASVITDKQREYLILRYHEYMRPIAIAQRYGVTKRAVNSVIKRAEDKLQSIGIKPPRDRDEISLRQKGVFPLCATVSPYTLAENTAG